MSEGLSTSESPLLLTLYWPLLHISASFLTAELRHEFDPREQLSSLLAH